MSQPEDWDEEAPYEILDEEAEKPEGWLDDEELTIPDPGECFCESSNYYYFTYCYHRRREA